MIVNTIGSIRDNFTKKVRNPFFGTLTVVFVLKNWQLFYSLLLFDSHELRSSRIEIIEKYIETAGGNWIFVKAVCWTFAILIISYILQGLGALISNFYDSIIHPWIISIATKGVSVVTKDKYELEVQKNKVLEDRLKEEREKRYSVESELDRIEKKQTNQSDLIEYVSDDQEVLKTNKVSHEEKVLDRIMQDNWKGYYMNLINFVLNTSTVIKVNNHIDKRFIDYVVVQGILTIELHLDEYGNKHSVYVFTEFGERVKKLFAEKSV